MKQKLLSLGIWVMCTVGSTAFAQDRLPQQSDGLLILKGTVREAITNEHVVSFVFAGEFSFSFFTGPAGAPNRKRIDLKFDIQRVPVSIPKFGREEHDAPTRPTVVNFKNAARHAIQASASGEPVTIVVMRPKLTYDIHGVIEKVECTHAQILPDSLRPK